MARLIALANAHDILTAESWESAELGDILARAVGMHQTRADVRRVSLVGPPLRLPPKSAVAVAMAAHELATNAAKYGALSDAAGWVEIAWGLNQPDGSPGMWLTWSEHGGPPVDVPSRRGFGSRLIERGLAGELDGTARLDFRREGLVCTIRAGLPVDEPGE